MKRLLLIAALCALVPAVTLADPNGSPTGGTMGTQSALAGCTYQSSPATLSNNQQAGLLCGSDRTLVISGTVAPTGTQDVNLKQVNGATVNVGTGAASTGTQRVTTSTDSTIGTVTSVTAVTTLGTVTNPVGVKGADGSTISSSSNPVPVIGTVTAADDAALTNAVKGYAIGGLYDGSTIDLARSMPAISTAGTGVPAAGLVGQYLSSNTTFTNAQYGPVAMGSKGSLRVELCGEGSVTCGAASGAGADGRTNSSFGLLTYNLPSAFNGTTWDRDFTCGSSAVVSVTAGNTTQIVALSGSTVIRVCSMALTSSLTGTAQFVYGTGSNCGSGTTNLTGAMTLTTGIPLALSAANGSLIRGAAANAVCLAAVTGNITGFISYTQY